MVNIDIKKQLTKFFIYITGLPGSGKLSTAIVLSSMINAVIVSGLEYNQTSKETQDRIYNTAQVMLQAVETYPIDSKNYIFLDDLMKNNNDNIRIYNLIAELSKKMNIKILPIVLRCNPLILQKRIILKKQRKNRKVTNINSIKFRAEDLFVPPNAIEIENSNMSIKEVAEKIVSQMYRFNRIDSIYARGKNFIY